MSTEERITELENRIKELETKNATNTITIATMNHTIGLMLEAIENNAKLMTTITENGQFLVY